MLAQIWSFFVRSGLVIGLGLVNYSIWFTADGFPKHLELTKKTSQLVVDNKHLQEDTTSLHRVITNIRDTGEILERKAREDLNMVGPGERLYRILEEKKA